MAYPTEALVDKDLCKLASYGVMDGVKTLVEAGQKEPEEGAEEDEEKVPFDINIKDKTGMSPFGWACRNGHVKVAQYLQESGANIEVASGGGLRPLHHAVNNNYEPIVEFLLDLNADVSAVDENGCTALHWASSRGVLNIIVRLIE